MKINLCTQKQQQTSVNYNLLYQLINNFELVVNLISIVYNLGMWEGLEGSVCLRLCEISSNRYKDK